MAFRTPLRTYCEVSDTCEERIVKASLSHIFFKTCFHVFIQMIEAITFSHVSDKKWDSKYDIKFYGIAEGIKCVADIGYMDGKASIFIL